MVNGKKNTLLLKSLVFMSKGHVTRNLQIKSYIITFLTKIDKMARL